MKNIDNPVYMVNPDGAPPISPEIQARHDKSVADYPDIHFLPTEYVVINVKRSVWGLVRVWSIAAVAFVVIIAATVMMGQIAPAENAKYVALVGLLLAILAPIGGVVGAGIYKRNSLIITSERAIMRHQSTPFSHSTQNIEIENIEDCSYSQNGIFQTMLNMGHIRLSTVGDEHTYVFNYVDDPAEQFKIVNNIVQLVDRGRATRYRE